MTRKNLLAAMAALAVMALVVAIVLVASRGSDEPPSTENELPAGHSDNRQTQPDPGDQPTGSGWNDQATDPSGVHGGNVLPSYHTIAIANAHLDAQGRLVIGYFVGLTGCYAQLDHVDTAETPANVTVTLVQGPDPQQTAGVACPDIAMSKSVRVALSAPLGQRTLIDGSTGHRVRVH
jgi:hypothetical protein